VQDEDERGSEADRAAAEHRGPQPCDRASRDPAPLRHRMPGNRDRLGERGLLCRQAVRDRDQVATGRADELREGAGARRHRQDLPARAEMRPAALAGRAASAGDERVDRDPLAVARPADDPSGGLVTEHQRRRPARIVAVIGVHVGSADPDRLDADQRLARAGLRNVDILHFERERAGVDERLHVRLISP
jgi:hypothetical protein